MPSIVLHATSPARRCAACHDDLTPGGAEPKSASAEAGADAVADGGGATGWSCRGCRTTLHRECLAGLRRCPTLGCRRPLRWPSSRRTRRRPLATTLPAAWRPLIMVVAPALVALLWPVFAAVGGLVAFQLGSDLRHDPRLVLGALGGFSALLLPGAVNHCALAPLARRFGPSGRHHLRTGLATISGYLLGAVWALLVVVELL